MDQRGNSVGSVRSFGIRDNCFLSYQLGRIYVAAFANNLLRKLTNDSDTNIKDDILIRSVSTIFAFYETRQPDIGHWKSLLIIPPEDQ